MAERKKRQEEVNDNYLCVMEKNQRRWMVHHGKAHMLEFQDK